MPEQYVGGNTRRGDLERYVEIYASYSDRKLPNLEKELLITAVKTMGPEWPRRRKESAAFTNDLIGRYRLLERQRPKDWKHYERSEIAYRERHVAE